MADLSKIKLGEITYNLKDATARSNIATLLGEHALAALEAGAWHDVTESSSLVQGSAKLPTEDAVKGYVDAQIGTINKFDVKIYQADSEGKPNVAASAQTMYILGLVADAHAEAGTYIEWITVRSGVEGSYTYAWEKIGSTQADLSDYLQNTATVAGVAFGQDQAITKSELQSALELGNMAYADTASGSTTLQTIDSITMDSVTVAGNAAVTHTSANASLTKGDYTPAGNISVTLENNTVVGSATQGTLPSKQEDTFSAGALPTFEEGAFSAGSLPSFTEGAFTANVPTAIDVSKFNGGSAATWTGAAHTAASLGNATKAQFAQDGLVGEVGTGDDAETLILTAATKANAVTEQGAFTPDTVDFGTFDGGSAASLASGFYSAGTAASKAADTFSAGSLPSKAADTFTQGALPSYTEGEFDAGSLPTFTNATVGVASQSFTGTKAENVLVTAVAYDKADATAAFSETVTPTVASYSKTAKDIEITVNPD